MQDIITVVVPVYNAEKYLKRCIDSIISQTYVNLDIILVNDGSTDRSGNICDEYAKTDLRIRVIHKKNEGVSVARNTGINLAKGKYLVFVDSDDYLEEKYCQLLYEVQQKYTEAFVICGFNTVSADKCVLDEYVYESGKLKSEVFKEDIIDLISKWLINMPWNKLYKTCELQERKIFMIEELSLAEDLLFNFEYIDKVVSNQIVVVNKPLYKYVLQDSNSLGSRYCPEQLEIMRRVNAELYTLCNNIGINNMELYYAKALQYLENALINNMKKDNPKNICAKIKENNQIMRSEEYQRYLQKSGEVFTRPRRLVCKMGNYLLLDLFFKACIIWSPIKEYLYENLKKPLVLKRESLWKKDGQK